MRAFEDKLNNLFNLFLAHANAIDLMQIQEDKDFLQLQQKSNRPGRIIIFVYDFYHLPFTCIYQLFNSNV